MHAIIDALDAQNMDSVLALILTAQRTKPRMRAKLGV